MEILRVLGTETSDVKWEKILIFAALLELNLKY